MCPLGCVDTCTRSAHWVVLIHVCDLTIGFWYLYIICSLGYVYTRTWCEHWVVLILVCYLPIWLWCTYVIWPLGGVDTCMLSANLVMMNVRDLTIGWCWYLYVICQFGYYHDYARTWCDHWVVLIHVCDLSIGGCWYTYVMWPLGYIDTRMWSVHWVMLIHVRDVPIGWCWYTYVICSLGCVDTRTWSGHLVVLIHILDLTIGLWYTYMMCHWVGTLRKNKKCCIKLCWPFFVTAEMLKEIFEIFDHVPLFSMSKKNPVLDQNLSWFIKTFKSCDLNVANFPRDTIFKTSPRHFTKIYHTCVVPISDYSAGIWGFNHFDSMNKIQNVVSLLSRASPKSPYCRASRWYGMAFTQV